MGNNLMCLDRVCRLSQDLEFQNPLTEFIEAAHQVENGVDDRPCQVAPQRTNQHRSNFRPTCPRNAEGACEGEDHDQCKQNLGYPVDWFEDTIGRPGDVFHQRGQRGSLLLLPTSTQCVVQLNQGKPFVQLRLCENELGIKIASVAVQHFEITRHSAAVAHI